MRLLLLLLPVTATAQWVTAGVTGGVPLSPETQTFAPSVNGSNDLYQKPYSVGPTATFYLPWNLSVQAGMLYERFHMDSSEGITPIKGGGANFGFAQSLAANAYAFPLLFQFNLGRGRSLSPFVEAGTTLRHLQTFTGQGIQYDFYLHPNPMSFTFNPDKALDVAITAGAGIRWHVSVFDVSPEVRYLHWTAPYEQPAQDQAMLMLTVSFPARR
jgi:hypothetical protein